MSLRGVQITPEVWLTCVTHALSTETEEIMGLLLGDTEKLEDGSLVAKVWSLAPQTRSDRRKDRVETNPEQLAAATAEAEKLTELVGKRTRVIGWYHSHPHITVMPSHVDVRTQKMLQMFDDGFVGLIFSCFNEDSNKIGRIQVTAFQSIISQDNQMNVDHGFESNAIDEAIQRSTLDSRSGEIVRKEVPLHVIPNMACNIPEITYLPLLNLQKILFSEERNAYHQSLNQSQKGGKIHPLTILHNSSTYQASLCKMIEYCLSPVINALEDRLHQNHLQLEIVQEENNKLRMTPMARSNTNFSNASTVPPRISQNPSSGGSGGGSDTGDLSSSKKFPSSYSHESTPSSTSIEQVNPSHRRTSYNPDFVQYDLAPYDRLPSSLPSSRSATATASISPNSSQTGTASLDSQWMNRAKLGPMNPTINGIPLPAPAVAPAAAANPGDPISRLQLADPTVESHLKNLSLINRNP